MKRRQIAEPLAQERHSSNDGYRAKLYRESSRLAHEGITSVTLEPPAVPLGRPFAPRLTQGSTGEQPEVTGVEGSRRARDGRIYNLLTHPPVATVPLPGAALYSSERLAEPHRGVAVAVAQALH